MREDRSSRCAVIMEKKNQPPSGIVAVVMFINYLLIESGNTFRHKLDVAHLKTGIGTHEKKENAIKGAVAPPDGAALDIGNNEKGLLHTNQ